MENNKVKAIKEWKIPTKIKEVESFLKFTNFYQINNILFSIIYNALKKFYCKNSQKIITLN